MPQLYLKYIELLADKTGMDTTTQVKTLCSNCEADEAAAGAIACADCEASRCVMCGAFEARVLENEDEPICESCREANSPQALEAQREFEFWNRPGWDEVFGKDGER